MSFNPVKIGLICFLTYHFAEANQIHITGTQQQTFALTHKEVPVKAQAQAQAQPTEKTITFPQFTLSEKVRQVMADKLDKIQERAMFGESLNSSVENKNHHKQLGMNKVPVLDQGVHGTCVTFAMTAAIDAVMKKGDYVSQLCLLQLGTYLISQGEPYSGWEGSFGYLTLDRLQRYGFISIKNQHKHGCGGSKSYPTYCLAPTDGMTIEQYAEFSEQMRDNKIKAEQLFSEDHLTANPKEPIVDEVKAAIDAGHRVAFSVLLPRTDLGTAGAVGWHHYFSDTWVVSSDVGQALNHDHNFSGHEMLITGYDDTAVAMDNWGHRHHGLFTVRNSWGSLVADWGDFYMSYDYFNALSMDAHVIYAADE
jgi:C1A family cysteine protease